MLVGAVGRTVDALPFSVDVGLKRCEQPLPAPALGPAIEPIEHGLPGAELFRQVAPGNPGSPPPHDSLEEPSIIPARTAAPTLRHQDCTDPFPLRVAHPGSRCHNRFRSCRRSSRQFLADRSPNRSKPLERVRARAPALSSTWTSHEYVDVDVHQYAHAHAHAHEEEHVDLAEFRDRS